MINRLLHKSLLSALNNFPIVGLIGSRQVGKTTLAKVLQLQYQTVYLDLELPSDLNKLQNAEFFLRQYENSLVIIDEIQRMPELPPLLRALSDETRRPGRFLILGSASPAMIKRASESLAGRILYLELSPFTISEVSSDNYPDHKLWLRGGYPESFLAIDDKSSLAWRQAYIKTYLEQDIPQLGIKIPAQQLRRFWTMLAHQHGSLWNASQIAKSMGLSAPTITKYLDILTDSFIVRQLLPYRTNLKKRLVKSPKVYIRDNGLLHALLNLDSYELLSSHPVFGSSWEGFVIEQLIVQLPENTEFFFYRSNAGAEIDFVYKDSQNQMVAVEIKLSLSPKPERGFWNAFDDLNCSRGFVIYPGKDSYPLSDKVITLPFANLEKIQA